MWPYNLKSKIGLACFMLVIALFCSCKTQKIVPHLTKATDLNYTIDTSSTLSSGFSGLVVYDLASKKTVFDRNGTKLFTPASNVKLFTLFACLKSLGDSIPALKYVETDSTFTFWGLGDPTFLHPYFPRSKVLDFLRQKARNKRMFYSENHNQMPAYGRGWMWDDYNDYYQPEISHFPVFGNVVTIKKDSLGFSINPTSLKFSWKFDSTGYKIQRDLDANSFSLPIEILSGNKFLKEVPYKNAANINIEILRDSLNQNLSLSNLSIENAKGIIYSLPVDTVYKRMMEVSDNLITEQLLLSCGLMVSDTFSSSVSIDRLKPILFDSTTTLPVWVDGSGLSRYNLVSPWTMVKLLEKMQNEMPKERLYNLLAQSGKYGTLDKMFTMESEPIVYGKSGSMRGVYNLSGFLKCKSGKTLVFSFMNNNMNTSVSNMKKEVERILWTIRNEH